MRLIAIIMTIMITFSNVSIGFADNNVSNVKTYKFENDVNMSGVISGNSKFFEVSKNWNLKNAKLNLVFTKSELLDIDYSTITVFINEKPIHSERLDGKKEYKKNISIEIPKDLLKKGSNEIQIKAYKTISDKVCRDDANTANWLVIHKESNINIEYEYKSSENILSEYQNSYNNTDNGDRLNSTILLPDNYSSAELSSGMILAADFGKKIKYDNFNFDFKLYSDFKNKNDNIIFIGKNNNTPKEILNLLTNSEKSNLDQKGIIKMVSSPFDKSKKMIIIVSNNSDILKKASKLLSSNDLINNLNKDSITIDKNTDINDLNDKENTDRIYLKDLGYENIMLKGPFSQEVVMDINTPKNKVVKSGSKVKLNIRYAQNLDFERSLATVYINDVPIGSERLVKEKSDNDTIELSLPNEVVGKSYYQVKVVFNLELLDVACVTRDTDNPWAYISNESFLEFDYEDNDDLSFNNYPYPFVENDKFNDLTVVVPNNLGSRELTYIANSISYMGHDVKFNDGNLNVVKESEFRGNYKKDNLIIVGTPSNNSIIKDINKDLNLKFNKNYNGFEGNDKIKFVGEFSSEVASIQLIDSPYLKDKSAMVIASTDIADLSLSAKYLSDLSLTKSLKGDTIVIGRDGYVKDLNYNAKEQTTKEELKEEKKISKQTKIFILVAVFLLATVITSLVLLVLKYRK
ncbi:cellulose biosynthesis cyclic di-GMP-binding regulatory protein BcsB [Romboutsia sedimentorum]|uniref:cellulose biosynthesis cyclic di-GMP-binding regulatory protein BcsB n=1 Tax=Romboutsia sedimentorum TaxID=1368474 RepID=UPI0024DEF802|nr:cellulose biosynthesis cyclic di-GMP-binding regulatory protein BcsB [Romboutsia sedimentorum]MDK2584376.1 cellulose biosynthesis cyclic di-GMP-binding regulatory protein BcsB [Romboutsia sedimentorum]